MRIIYALTILLCCLSSFSTAKGKTGEIDKLIRSYYNTERFMGCVLVAEKGKVILRKSFGYANLELKVPNTTESVFRIGSVTKCFTAVVIMQLIEEGKLKTDSRLSDLLPYYRKDIGQKITVHHLLSHSSGIPNFTQLPGFMTDRLREPVKTIGEFITAYCSGEPEFEPSAKFNYNNSGYFILGAIIENLCQESLERVFKHRIFDRLGMKNTGIDRVNLLLSNRAYGYQRNYNGRLEPADYWELDWTYAAGQLYSTADDLMKFHNALQNESLIKKESAEMMINRYFQAPGIGYYGYGWMLRDFTPAGASVPLRLAFHEGRISGYNTYFVRVPEKDQLIVILNNTSEAPLSEMTEQILTVLNKPDKPI